MNQLKQKRVQIMSIITFKTVKDLDKAISQIIVDSKTQRDMIQNIAVGIVSHAALKGNGNVTRAKTLVDGLGEGVRCDSLVEWFSIVGITFSDEGEVSLDRELLTSENMEKAKGTFWYQAKKAVVYKVFDLKAMLAAQLKQAYKAANDAKADPEKAALVLMSEAELTAFEAYVRTQVKGADLPKKPDSLKALKGAPTATGKKAA